MADHAFLNLDNIDVLWVTLDLDFGMMNSLDGPKKLANICAEKLVSDVSLVARYCLKLPKSIHSLILSTAIAKKRVLSVQQLMKFCPHQTLVLPTPDYLKQIGSLHEKTDPDFYVKLVDFTNIAITMLSVFFDLIQENNSINSELQTLDLGMIPLGSTALKNICDFLFKKRRKVSVFKRTYTLRCAVGIGNTTDLHILNTCVEKSTSLGFFFDVIGVYFHNTNLIDVEILMLLNILKKANLQLFAFSFMGLHPDFNCFLNSLQNFRNVKYLNFTYVRNLLPSEIEVRNFASGLSMLTDLERLVFRGITLTNLLPTLFCNLLRRGSLQHLEISSCRLSDTDLQILREMPATNSLRYLDISNNILNVRRTFECLLFLKNSLEVLNISYCFRELIEYDNAIMPFCAFAELKYLNIKDLRVSENSKDLLKLELQKMPKLETLEASFS